MNTTTTFVYVVEARGGYIKIGCSERPEVRLAAIRTHSPLPTRLLAQWPGAQAEERALHKRFIAQRSHGEWFRFEDGVVRFVAEVMGRGLDAVEAWERVTFPTSDEKKADKAARHSAALRAKWADPAFRRQTAIAREWQKIVAPFRRADHALPRWFTADFHRAVDQEAKNRFDIAGPRLPGPSSIERKMQDLAAAASAPAEAA